ncbi:MAG TPA: NUDIX hydrolase [Dehalococcoidia bacterium]
MVKLRVDTVALAGGRTTQREVVEHGEVVAMVPLDAQGNVVLVRQYRLPAGQALLEVPAGGVRPDETPEQAAERELREETGYRPGRLQPVTGFYVAPGYCTEYIHLYLAEDLREDPLDGDEDEQVEVVRLPLREAVRLVETGQIQDAKSIIGLLAAAGRKGV